MNKNDISIVVADDHPMLLKGFSDELESNDYQVIGKAKNGSHALGLIVDKNPTIAFLDIDMPNLSGFEVINIAKLKGVKSKFVIFSFHRETDYIFQAKSLQIDGYLLKEDSFVEVERCIQSVLDNKQYYSPSFDVKKIQLANDEMANLNLLTASEKMILRLVAERTSTQDIAATLGVSTRTIEKHRSNIISKLSLNRGTNSLTNWALVHKSVILNM